MSTEVPSASDLSPQTWRPHDVGVLQTARVGIVGVGALGHHVALDLARAGVTRLRLVDGDIVTADTASRQYPLTLAGESKTWAAKRLINGYNPWTYVETRTGLVGGSLTPDEVMGGDLTHLIDATAEPSVTRVLAHMACAQGIDFYSLAATGGVGGGTILCLPAVGEGGCYACFEHQRAEGSLPVPPERSGGWTVPPGCSAPTFVGYGHDLAVLAHQCSRRVIADMTLPDATRPGYLVGDLSDDGAPPTWRFADIAVHPACPRKHLEAQVQLHLT